MAPFSLLIQTNSPGEVSTWLRPVVTTFKSMSPDSTINVFLTPCQYASGKEADVARSIEGVTEVFTPRQTIKHIKTWPWKQKKNQNGAVLYLGGDPLYSHLLGLKYGYPVYGYTEHPTFSKRFFTHLFYKHIDGDLMGDRLLSYLNHESKPIPTDPYCLFFTGSRLGHFQNLLPFYNDCISIIQKQHPDFRAKIQISPFIPAEIAANYIGNFPDCDIYTDPSLDRLKNAKLLITIPGSNTAEAMYLHVPMIVFIPLNNPETLIFDGLPGLLAKLPYTGALIQKSIIWYLSKRPRKNYALPNIIAGKSIVPEKAGILTAEEVAADIINLYYNQEKLAQIQTNLSSIPKPQPVSEKICKKILDVNQS